MDLSDEQKRAVARWVGDDLTLSEIQTRLNEEFGVSMTYMDVRFLVDDLDLTLADKPKPLDPEEAKIDAGPAPEERLGEPGQVKVEVSKVAKPGAILSGTAIFSDGEKVDWTLDQLGRMSLNPPRAGYQPPADDIAEFQSQLQQILQSQGF